MLPLYWFDATLCGNPFGGNHGIVFWSETKIIISECKYFSSTNAFSHTMSPKKNRPFNQPGLLRTKSWLKLKWPSLYKT